MKKNQPPQLSLLELRLAILQVLRTAQAQRQGGGASGKMLFDCLAVKTGELVSALRWLLKQSFIEMDTRQFSITGPGLAYLDEHLPRRSSPGGGYFQRRGPDHPSGVPNRPFPFSGAGAIALSEPQPEIEK